MLWVRPSEEQSDELATPYIVTKTTHTRLLPYTPLLPSLTIAIVFIPYPNPFCDSLRSFAGFLISMLYPAVRILGAATGDEVGTGMYNDSAFMAGPASAAAMVTSVFLQPKNMNKVRSDEKRSDGIISPTHITNNLPLVASLLAIHHPNPFRDLLRSSQVYMRFLWIQAILTTLSPLIIYLSATSSSTLAWIVGFFAFISGMGVFSCSLAVRVRAANLDPKPLSRFLTDSVLIPSITTLCILTFFILDPIRCWAQLGEGEIGRGAKDGRL